VKCEITAIRDRLQYVYKEYRFPDEIRFSCPKGYKLSGASGLACTGSGNWNDTFPTCDGNVISVLSKENYYNIFYSIKGR